MKKKNHFDMLFSFTNKKKKYIEEVSGRRDNTFLY